MSTIAEQTEILSVLKLDIAAKRHKKHKNKISGFVNSKCYNEQKSKSRLFTKPSKPVLMNNLIHKISLTQEKPF
jgi:hypothetical protein